MQGKKEIEVLYERVTDELLPAVRAFCRENWGSEHPLIHNEEMFDYYYREGESINFVAAYTPEREGETDFLRADKIRTVPLEVHGVCGFIKTNSGPSPDVFLSYILTKKGAPFGMAFKLIELIREMTECRTLACNNIRKKTRGIYDFLEYTVADMIQWYRLNEEVENLSLVSLSDFRLEPIQSGEIDAVRVAGIEELEEFPFFESHGAAPYKDIDYVNKRYFKNPWLEYQMFRLCQGERQALLVLREIESRSSRMLRVVDFIGDRSLIKESGRFLDGYMKKRHAEFVDWYAYGVPQEDMEHAGFTIRYSDDDNIIPMYYTPFLLSNVDVTVFVSDPDNYMMFRADGDQDRPNLG